MSGRPPIVVLPPGVQRPSTQSPPPVVLTVEHEGLAANVELSVTRGGRGLVAVLRLADAEPTEPPVCVTRVETDSATPAAHVVVQQLVVALLAARIDR